MKATSDNENRYVVLPRGLAVPVEPFNLLHDLESRGFRISRIEQDVSISPASKLTDADRAAVLRWKRHVLALIDYVTTECPQ